MYITASDMHNIISAMVCKRLFCDIHPQKLYIQASHMHKEKKPAAQMGSGAGLRRNARELT
jgi:hypothetical protein